MMVENNLTSCSDSWNTLEPQVINQKYTGQRIMIYLEPQGRLLSIPRAKTVRQLLAALELDEETALVAREGKLLTPDRRIWPDDKIYVRVVLSSG